MKTKYNHLALFLISILFATTLTACCECCGDGPDDTDYTYTDCEKEATAQLNLIEKDFSSPGILTMSITADKDTFSDVGEVITYTYEITNPSDSPQTLKNLTLQDDIAAVTCPKDQIFQETINCTGSYTVTIDDITAGFIENHATASTKTTVTYYCTYRGGTNKYTYSDERTFENTASAFRRITTNAEPVLSLSKTASPSFYSSYQDVNYTFALTNNGNVSLSSPFSLIDDLIDSWYCEDISSLDPGDTMYCYGSSFIDAGLRWTITNTATACGYFGDTQICSNSASASVFFRQPEIPDEPGAIHCGDGIVQFDLGEECDPPEPGLCSSECKYE